MAVGTFVNSKTSAQKEFFFNRLVKNYRHLKKWARRTGTESYRVYDRDIPEIPLALDVYALVPCSGGIASDSPAVPYAMMYLYERPYQKDEAEEDEWLSEMKDAASLALGVPAENIIVSVRRRQRGANQYVKTDRVPAEGAIVERGAKFLVSLGANIDTGIFLDHRILRGIVRGMSDGKRVLNLFSYTCAFSVCAALGGASRVDSVDLSNTYLETGARNFVLNGIPASGAYSFVRKDVREFLAESARKKLAWDAIILDPPTFSNSKKTRTAFDINRDWSALVNASLDVLAEGGTLYFSANGRRFRFDGELVQKRTARGYAVRFAERATTDEDFRRRAAHKSWVFTASA